MAWATAAFIASSSAGVAGRSSWPITRSRTPPAPDEGPEVDRGPRAARRPSSSRRGSSSRGSRRSAPRRPCPSAIMRAFTGAIDAALAGDLGGDALGDLAGRAVVDEHVVLGLAEHVDEAGAEDEAARRRCGVAPRRATRSPTAAMRSPDHAHVGAEPRRAGAVDHPAAGEDEVVHRRPVRRRATRPRRGREDRRKHTRHPSWPPPAPRASPPAERSHPPAGPPRPAAARSGRAARHHCSFGRLFSRSMSRGSSSNGVIVSLPSRRPMNAAAPGGPRPPRGSGTRRSREAMRVARMRSNGLGSPPCCRWPEDRLAHVEQLARPPARRGRT